MKIGILTSSNDMLALFQFAHRYDHEYIIWYDDQCAFWLDKSLDFVMSRIQMGMEFLSSKSVDMVIVPPIVELALMTGSVQYTSPIPLMPLFSTYVRDYCLSYSLVGKIGFAGDWLDINLGQEYFKKLSSNYVLTDNQAAIKKFHFPLAWRGKEVRLWRFLLEILSWSNPLVNTLIKNDLKYFKNAAVDTLIPMNYSYFWAEKTITHLLNAKTTKFHRLDVLESIFVKLAGEKSKYSVSVVTTGHGESLTKNKRLLWLLDQGKSGNLNIEKI